MKAHTTHYALTRVREENPTTPPTSVALGKHETLCSAGWGVGEKLQTPTPVRGFYQQRSLRSIRVPGVSRRWEPALCTKQRVLPSIMQRVNIAGCRCCGVWFHGTHSAPLMKVEERRGVSEHQRLPGTSLHCTRTCTPANWFSTAGTCPRRKTTNAFTNGTVKWA